MWSETLTDNVEHTGTFDQYADADLLFLRPDIGGVYGIWTALYDGINRVNLLIQKVPEIDQIDGGLAGEQGLDVVRVPAVFGDNGKFGREEIDVLEPAIQRCREKKMDVTGPWPSDTVFLKARRGEVDAVVTMYHDQGQIAIKLLGFDRGVTVAGGLPMLRVVIPSAVTVLFSVGTMAAHVPMGTRAMLIWLI